MAKIRQPSRDAGEIFRSRLRVGDALPANFDSDAGPVDAFFRPALPAAGAGGGRGPRHAKEKRRLEAAMRRARGWVG